MSSIGSSVSTSPLRRSTRSTAGRRQDRLYVSNLTEIWRRLYLDMNHCRLQKCIQTMRNASERDIAQLRQANTAFVAMAVSAASAYGSCKEDLLLEYVHVVTQRGLDANDKHNGNSALVLACYHSYKQVVDFLLELGCSLDSHGRHGNAVAAAVKNGQHEILVRLLEQRPQEVSELFHHDAFSRALERAICKNDVKSVRLVACTRGISKPTINDRHFARMKHGGRVKRHLLPLLRQLYPSLKNVASWNQCIHWSFPTSDRRTLNLLWYTAGENGRVFPSEIWLVIFSFIGRGWFKRENRAVAIYR